MNVPDFVCFTFQGPSGFPQYSRKPLLYGHCYDLLFPLSFSCLCLSAYLRAPFPPLTILSYSINSALHLLIHLHAPLLLHASTCTPQMTVHLTHRVTHGPLLTLVDLPSSLYCINVFLSSG